MMEWITAQWERIDDPFLLVVGAPVVLGILYVVLSFTGERGK